MTVHLEWRDRVAVVTIDRAERRNALDHATLLSLRDRWDEVTRGGARCLVLTGAAPAFCAGADLNGVESNEFLDLLGEVLQGLAAMPLPTIAAIDGPALGAGAQLAVACDFRVATATSQVGVPAAKLGLAVDQWTITRMAEEFGPAVARAMLVAAQVYVAAELVQMGAFHRVGSLTVALDWAQQLAQLAPLTITAHKLGLAGHADFDAARRRAWDSADANEGRQAFLDKRPAAFEGR